MKHLVPELSFCLSAKRCILVVGISAFLSMACQSGDWTTLPLPTDLLEMQSRNNQRFTDFTDSEIAQAYEFILPPDEAGKIAAEANRMPLHEDTPVADGEVERGEVLGPTSYDGDFLDLMTLVSSSCAQRAWHLMRITPSEGVERRHQFIKRLAPILRRQPDV